METLDYNVYSYLCHSFMNEKKELQVCKSAAGYYIGIQGYSRDSVEYYRSKYEAQAAFSSCSWTQRMNP